MDNRTPCDERRHCYFEEYFGNRKCCRVLNADFPYESGKCPYYKPTKNSYSGNYEGVEYSDEQLRRIEEKEIEYKSTHGIMGRRGGQKV